MLAEHEEREQHAERRHQEVIGARGGRATDLQQMKPEQVGEDRSAKHQEGKCAEQPRARYDVADVSDIVPSARLLGAFAFLVLGGSILAYLLWFHLLKVCGATAASAYHFLMPPLGMLFAFLVLGEHVEFRDLLGIVPVALGIYLVTRSAASASSKGGVA